MVKCGGRSSCVGLIFQFNIWDPRFLVGFCFLKDLEGMGVWGESWCFCNGGGKSERMKAAILSGKSPAMARVNGVSTGFLIHRNLLLTTHVSLPSVAAAESAEIQLINGVSACLFPHRFFITSSILDLTMVGLDIIEGESNALAQQPHYLKSYSKPNLELGSLVYLLGYTKKEELVVGEGKVVIATDNLIKLSTEGITWSPGSAGFDVHGNLAFMVCDPMKLATSPNTKSSSTSSSSSSSWKKDMPMQFGIPIRVILDWLHQHWDGNLDELNKPKLPLKRLMSSKSEHSCASFIMRRVFKSTEGEYDGTTGSYNMMTRPLEQPGPSSPVSNILEDEALGGDRKASAHVSGIPTPEIYESRMLTSIPVRKNHNTIQIQLLDGAKADDASSPKQVNGHNTPVTDMAHDKSCDIGPSIPIPDAESTGSVNGAENDIQSSSSPVDTSELPHEYSSEGETTMYSAETAESRNYTSPREGKLHQVGRSQSCVSYNRWTPVQRSSVARGAMLEKHRSFTQGRNVHSQGAASHRSIDYFSPTLSSIMKKRNNMEQQHRPRQSAIHTSPRWNF